MVVQTFKHWRCEIDDNQIFWLIIHRADKSVNMIHTEAIKELNAVIDLIEEQRKNIIGVAIKNGNKTGFIMGADINDFTKLKDDKAAKALTVDAQKTFMRIDKLKVPTIALIDGFALGGGLELSLACTYRVALDSPNVKIGLPEVLLGIQPAWGGSVRLPKLIGAIPALKLMLTGRMLNAKQAKKAGIVDDIARSKHLLENAAIYYLTKKPKPHRPNWFARLTNMKPFRSILAAQFRSKTKKKVNPEHYPAPFEIIDNWEKNGVDLKDGQAGEANAIVRLFNTDTGKQLIRVFFLREQLKRLGKEHQFDFKHVHVIGAGTMGGDIAAFCALRGYKVTLQDREMKYIAPAIKRAHKLFKKRLEHKRDATAAMDRLVPDVDGRGVEKADVIIEAIFEDLKVKKDLYKSIEPKMKTSALLATNTSSIPLEDLSKALKKPERLVGIHFFNPVAKMQLVEVVRGKNSADEEMNKALSFVGQLGKLPVPVKSSPGFLINRILMPYLLEAFTLMDEGVAPAKIDKAAVDFGMPMGPLELSDVVGLDVAVSVGKTLQEHFGGEIPKKMEELVDDGHYGKKTGSGVYTYRDGKPVKVSLYQQGDVPSDLADRLILRMINEAVACLDEKVIEDKDHLDAGMIFGTGFAPFRGGPIQYIESEGAENIYKRLEKLEKKYGESFKPHKGWKKFLKKKSSTKKGKSDARV